MSLLSVAMADKTAIKRYAHTIKHLRLEQLYYRAYYYVIKPSIKPSITLSRRPWTSNWSAPQMMTSGLSNSGEFIHLGESGNINTPSIWNSSTHSKLWLYNLHYFDALNASDADVKHLLLLAYIETWINQNPPLKGNGWEPYPISLRVVNWIKWFSRTGIMPVESWLDSLGFQAYVLMQRIEYHILGNHLFANGKALIFLGVYCSGKRADAWLHKGLKILDREIKEQFLPDGGHFELSPMYHASLLWDVCDLLHLVSIAGCQAFEQRVEVWTSVVERGLVWLSRMVHPDGDIAFFNDAALGIAPTFSELLLYAERLGVRLPGESSSELSVQGLEDTGYYVVHLPNRGKAILDLANVGPDYQPGHAHADTLSFELSLYGQRFLVNAGISQYGNDDTRSYQRSTKAHNTICVDGENSSDVWSGFRVAQRAYPFDPIIREDLETIFIACSHDGYLRRPGKNIHRRSWTFSTNGLLVVDTITGVYTVAEARFYFHPDMCMMKIDDHRFEGQLLCRQRVSVDVVDAIDANIESSSWYPYFGKTVDNQCLVIRFHGNELKTQWTW